MVTFLSIITNLMFLLLGYLIGSLNTSLIIGKKFFKIDVREHHSKNAGYTNAKRVLGSKIAALILFIDIFKSILAVLIAFGISYVINKDIQSRLKNSDELVDFRAVSLITHQLYLFPIIAGIGNLIGHVWPVFFDFRGGKGVASIIGILVTINIILVVIFIIVYFIVLYFWKYVSLSSALAASISGLFALIPWISADILGYFNGYGDMFWLKTNLFYITFIFYLLALAVLLWSHRSNFIRIKEKTERKVDLFKNNKNVKL
ncbi:glycerol-3-phosphate acyltransferase PlsY [Mycoplasmopsis mustelae]|uniref:Glycerol-3-phosphate acyltransferase n=1 Tax=Mycoplasmopsis mustelae TaxID=171289 RepID=A0A4R7UCY2_9BACT|nr:glycerol-3-phosphate 1-O-acyltransferase PlsY [Mycoplasmopsis mustelae]TDV24307.1 glycerol-3-phosphate acyltransferase PlsY [Mycoplasmopsis mustelae]